MRSTTPFDVVLVPFPFSDLSSAKKRPCLVLASVAPARLPEHLIVCMITSQLEGVAFPYDHMVVDLSAAGLPKPSLVRLAKMVTIEATMIQKRLGTLAKKDSAEISRALNALLSGSLQRLF